MKKRFYGIRKGHKTGVHYGYWSDIEKYIKGYSRPEFKGFNKIEDAKKYCMLTIDKKKNTLKVNIDNISKKQAQNTKTLNKESQNKLKAKEVLGKQRKELSQKLIFSKDIISHKNKTTVSIILLGHQKLNKKDRPGYYEYILIHENSGRYIKKESDLTLETTPNKAIIRGLVDGIKLLNQPCHIKCYSKISLGFKKMINESPSPNANELKELKELLLEKEHVIEEIVDIDIVVDFLEKYK